MVGWVDELDGVASSGLQGDVGDGETLRPTVNIALGTKKLRTRPGYLQGDVNVFVNRESAVEDVRVFVHNNDGDRGGVTLGIGPRYGLAGVLNPAQACQTQLRWFLGPLGDRAYQ